MAQKYDHQSIEKKWQQHWEETKAYVTTEDVAKEKSFLLVEFPYPSGAGLHVGHVRSYTAMDVVARKQRAEGKNVLYPIGWDAFGLPTENYAVKTGIQPKIVTAQNTDTFRRQMKSLGFSFDWSREVNTTDPAYYKWTQWIFLKLFTKGLAYKQKMGINWCLSCKIGLANEEVVDGKCERCGGETEKREKEQWMLAITKYADRLHDDLDSVEYWEKIKIQQRNWIGRSFGAEIDFPVAGGQITGDVIFATNNKGKIVRMQKLFKEAGLSVTLKTPKDIGIEDFDVVEDQQTLAGNAEKKVRTLAQKTDLPIFADDSGFFIEGVKIDPVTVKRNALAGVDEKTLSVEEIGKRMQEYYAAIANEKGGSVEAQWHNGLCLLTTDRQIRYVEAIRPVTLTNESHGEVDPHLPLRGLYISKATGKYVLEQTEKEEMLELKPITDGVKQLFNLSIQVFTTRPDTLFGATYMVVAPEHDLVQQLRPQIQNWEEVVAYILASQKKEEIERTAEGKEKTGVELEGIKAINPATKEEIPVFIADYVLANYGTGAIMAVPAHDERDFAFAQKFKLTSVVVVAPHTQIVSKNIDTTNGYDASYKIAEYHPPLSEQLLKEMEARAEKEFEDGFEHPLGPIINANEGILIHSGLFNGMASSEAKEKITASVGGKMVTRFKLRDWIFSRQRYWGEPIPLIYCQKDGWVAVPDDQLPVELPEVASYVPTDSGESPLAAMTDWVNTVCPKCGGPGKRETDTMPNWAGSSWYYLRYMDAHNAESFVGAQPLKYWNQVDWYNGGMEHTTLHLLYSRFWHKVLFDLGLVPTNEPYLKRTSHGLILAEGGVKMSKSVGNVVNPDDIVVSHGADTLRLYEMFMGPFDQPVAWNMNNVMGARRFIERVWNLHEKVSVIPATSETESLLHATIQKVSSDIDALKMNTAVSHLMVLSNHLADLHQIPKATYENLLVMLAPFAPHVAHELWALIGNANDIRLVAWPDFDASKIAYAAVAIGVQVNGKVRGTVKLASDTTESDALAVARAEVNVAKWLAGAKEIKAVYVPGRIISFVIQKLDT